MLADYKKPEDIIGENSLLKQSDQSPAGAGEMTEQFGYEKHDPAGHHSGNSRNGKTTKTLKADFGKLEWTPFF